jgi:hypothetical protein
LKARCCPQIVTAPRVFAGHAMRGCTLASLYFLITGTILPHTSWARQDSSPWSVRPCKASDQTAISSKKAAKQKKHRGTVQQNDTASACVEASGSAIHIQEQLQSLVRQQRWPVSNEDISETTWTFDVSLNKERLLLYAKPDSASERVEWQDGKAQVVVRSWDLGDGFARTVVSAKFEGFGESPDSFATQRSPWTLISKGILEAKIVEGLGTRVSAPR